MGLIARPKNGDRLLFPQFHDGKASRQHPRNWGKSSLSPFFIPERLKVLPSSRIDNKEVGRAFQTWPSVAGMGVAWYRRPSWIGARIGAGAA
jgi:hypothetical protein